MAKELSAAESRRLPYSAGAGYGKGMIGIMSDVEELSGGTARFGPGTLYIL